MSIDVSGLINSSWADHLNDVSGKDGIVEYDLLSGYREGRQGNIGISEDESTFIREIFNWLGDETGLSFKEINDRSYMADINIYSTSGYRDSITGQSLNNILGATMLRPWGFDVTWKDEAGEALTIVEKETIVHEVFHALGLGHPYGDGFNASFLKTDTIMSYNDFDIGYNAPTSDDMSALRSIWG